MNINIKWFDTFEEREAYFKAHISALVPETYLGAKEFWRQFGAIKAADVVRHADNRIAFIPGFPQDGLAFSSPLQVLRAAAMGEENALERERATAADFNISHLLGQALRTLSGGETIRLALAKVYLNATSHRKLCIASPFSWLDDTSPHFIDMAADAYLRRDKPVEFLALAGENETAVPALSLSTPGPGFRITTAGLRIQLSQSFSLGADPLWAVVGDCDLSLTSPCLVQGENGAGKSLFSKVLADVVGSRGKLVVAAGDNDGPPRLLHQNTLSQSLFRVGNEFAPLATGPVFEEYRDLLGRLRGALGSATDGDAADRTIQGVKTALLAARLCGRPKLLILDEPEWGLNQRAATQLVRELCEIAHGKGVPVMIVSHKPWFGTMAASRIRVSKHAAPADAGVFAIEVTVP